MSLRDNFWWNYCTKRYNSEYRRVLLKLVEPNSDATYLDLGCGNGELAARVASTIGTPHVYGIDSSEKLIYEAQEKGMRAKRYNLNRRLLWHDSVFDVITASQIIEHLDDTDLFIKEIRRMLKPEGYAIISTNNLASLHWLLLFALGKQPPTACVSDWMPVAGYSPNGSPMHRRLFTADGLTKLLKFHGLQVEKVMGTYYFPLPVLLARGLCKIDKVHSTCITVKARKT